MIVSHDDEPKTVQETLSSYTNDEWMKAMNNEKKSIRLIRFGFQQTYCQGEMQLRTNRFFKSNVRWIVQQKCTKLDYGQKTTPKRKVLTMGKPSHWYRGLPQFDLL